MLMNLQLFSEEETGVEEALVAGEQEVIDPQVEETGVVQEDTGVDVPDVAGQVKDEKDVAAALKARETQLRKQIETEYSEKIKGLESQSQYLDRVAKFYGFDSHDEFIKSFEEAEQNKRIEAEAAKLGVPEEVIRDHLQPLNQKLQSYETELKQLKEKEFQRQIEADINSLKSKYDDFEEYQEKVFAKAIEKGYSLEDAYILVSHQDKLERLGKETEQQVLARITGRDEKQVLSSKDKAGNITFDPENMSLEDIEKISERVQRGEKITF